ncbi:MAG: NAD(P)H-dependent glycerol-3-phosphate dehydrogenase [bacterium]|nr:NAD(P)H-dependent glycerol-3-phosphate dehydrogenase [bacterium]
MKIKVGVLGGGSWGTTLAILLHEKGFYVKIWEFLAEQVELIKERRENVQFLPGVFIPNEIEFTTSLEDVVKEAEVIVIVLPSQVVRNVVKQLVSIIRPGVVIVSAVKGLEITTMKRISEVINEELPRVTKIGVISGPSHAEEVSRKIPTAIVSAAAEDETAKFIQDLFLTPNLRVYTNTDLIGVELGGALKNIVAIAAGISDGLGLGDNTKAALITRGLVEIIRVGEILGARKSTFLGLSGLGDLVVTCTSNHSRNRHLGEMIGKGISLEDALSSMVMVAEGVPTTKAAKELAKQVNIELPITNEVYNVLFEEKNPKQAVTDLMLRSAKREEELV